MSISVVFLVHYASTSTKIRHALCVLSKKHINTTWGDIITRTFSCDRLYDCPFFAKLSEIRCEISSFSKE
jgi:hypothetical protein